MLAKLGWGLFVVSLGLNVFFWFGQKNTKIINVADTGKTEGDINSFIFLSPRIFAQQQNDILINFINLRDKLKAATESASQGERLGLYFEYLPSGVSIGANEKENFVLASLLKVPLVIGVYKQIAQGQLIEDTVLEVKEKNIDPDFGNLWKRGAGKKLTVKEAIWLTLTESDNTAKSVLWDQVPEGAMEHVFDSLDIPKERDEVGGAVVTPKNYASILKSLYFSSYLDKEYSNLILEQLTKTKFGDKLAAGIPAGVNVAHKIGVYSPGNPASSIYTDCGIVYVPKRPFLLCLMARTDEDKARQWMRGVAQQAYEYVATANPE